MTTPGAHVARGSLSFWGMILSAMLPFPNRPCHLRWPPTIGRALLTAVVLVIAARPAWGGDTARQVSDAGPMTEMKAMLLKYAARCALDPSQRLSAGSAEPPATRGGKGSGTAPPWPSPRDNSLDRWAWRRNGCREPVPAIVRNACRPACSLWSIARASTSMSA